MVSSAILRPMWANKIPSGVVSWMYRWFMTPFKNNDWWIRMNMKGQIGLGEDYFPDFKASFQETTEASLIHVMDRAMRFRLPAGLDKVEVPTLVVCGKKEYREMRESVRDLVSALPNACGSFVSLGRSSTLVKEHSWGNDRTRLVQCHAKGLDRRPSFTA